MAVKKAPGRPKGESAPKRSEATKESKVESSEIKDQDNAEIDQSTDKAKEKNEQDLAGKEKVVEVKVKTQNKTRLKPSEKRKITHTVFVRGKEREMSREAYDAVSKDPALSVELPKGSRLVEPELDKPCKDC